MTCAYKDCNYKCLIGYDRCHVRSHSNSIKEFEDAKDEHQKQFEIQRVPHNKFYLYNVAKDGACLYRAMANGLMYNIKYIENKALLLKLINEHLEKEVDDLTDQELDELGLMPLPKTLETKMAAVLQQVARQWIMDHHDLEVEMFGGMTIGTMVLACHDLDDLDTYDSLYKIFAGDEDFVLTYEERTYKSGKKKGETYQKKVKKPIPYRWGGEVEQYALSEFFGIPIKVFVPQRLNKRTFEVIEAKPSEGHYYLMQVNNRQRLDEKPDAHVDLLLTNATKYNPHFQLLV